jgi:hypothetical protein
LTTKDGRIRKAPWTSELRQANEGTVPPGPKSLAAQAFCSTEDRETSSEVKDNLTQLGKVDEEPVDHIE